MEVALSKAIHTKQTDMPTWFASIANELLLRSCIVTSEATYRFKEIEFYYHSADHIDTSTYGYMNSKFNKDGSRIHRHKRRHRNNFTWFIHYSGIDIVFGDEKNPGGILIRSLERINPDGSTELIKRPWVVMLELLNQSVGVFGGKGLELRTKVATLLIVEVKKAKRVGLGTSDYQAAEYNFQV